MNDEPATVLNDLRKALAKSEARLAKCRSKHRKSLEVRQVQALLEHTHDSLKESLEQIEKSHHAIAMSLKLLEKMKKRYAAGLQPSTPMQNVPSRKQRKP